MKLNFFTKSFLILQALCYSDMSFSQKENNTWYFGNGAGIDFNSGAPVALVNANPSFIAAEGCASISDRVTGNLLFYTDGIKVYNKTHAQMPNGSGLFGAPSSTQAALIVPFVGNPNSYYIFTTDNNGFNYSVVDMTLNGGNGDVTTKNVNLAPVTMEKLTGLRHSNCTDYWVVDHGVNNIFRSWLVTAAGVSVAPVVSSVGMTPGGPGYLKGSNKSNKIILLAYFGNTNNTQIFDFNNTTGVISNPQLLSNNINSPYSAAFSPNDSLFYLGYISGVNQYETYSANIPATEVQIAAPSGLATLELGPNCKIYVVPGNGTTNLGVINNPNSKTLPGYTANAISLAGKPNNNGLPNFMSWNSNFKAKFGFTTTACSLSVQFSDSSGYCTSGITNWLWNFGDGGNSSLQNPAHTYSSSGTYSVTLVASSACRSNSITIPVTVSSPVNAAVTVNSHVICNGASNGSATANAAGSTPPYAYLWSNSQTNTIATNLSIGIYTVTVTDSSGCSNTQTISITQPTAITATATSTSATCDDNNGSAIVNADGGTPGYSFSWNPSLQTSQTATGLAPGNYTATITDANGCTNTLTVNLANTNPSLAGELYLPNAFSPNDDGDNELLQIYYGNPSCIKSLKLVIYDRWGEKVFETSDTAFTWDGSYKNKNLKAAVFAYYVNVTTINNAEVIKRGNISLVR